MNRSVAMLSLRSGGDVIGAGCSSGFKQKDAAQAPQVQIDPGSNGLEREQHALKCPGSIMQLHMELIAEL